MKTAKKSAKKVGIPENFFGGFYRYFPTGPVWEAPFWHFSSPRDPSGGARFGTFLEPFCLVGAQTEAKSKGNAYLEWLFLYVFGVWPKSGLISGETGDFLPRVQLTRD